jgi:hypothetical protein
MSFKMQLKEEVDENANNEGKAAIGGKLLTHQHEKYK